MNSKNVLLKYNLNCAAKIIRKYNLGDKEYFFSAFSEHDESLLDESWAFAFKKVKNKDIIKDTAEIFNKRDAEEIEKSTNYIKQSLLGNLIGNYAFLNKSFDVRNLNFKDERRERRLRHNISLLYIEQCANDCIRLKQTEKIKRSEVIIYKIRRYLKAGSIILLVSIVISPRLIKGFTPPEKLLNTYLQEQYPKIKNGPVTINSIANFILEDTRYKSSGAICNDGWVSHSHGRGTCSHHGGVDYYFYEGDYSQSTASCLEKANKIYKDFKQKAYETSWRDDLIKLTELK